MNLKLYLKKLICKVKTKTGSNYCTSNPNFHKSLDPDEIFDVLTKKIIPMEGAISFEIMNLPEGSTPFSVAKMTDEEINDVNSKTLKDIEKINDRALILSEEYCANLEACKQLICNDPFDPYLELKCLKSGGDIKAQWLKCIQSKKQKALKMLEEEKAIAKKDDDTLAAEEIDSLCDLINEIDHSKIDDARSEREALMYWPALLLPAPKIKLP